MILFVCRGNQVRSPIAKAYFNELAGSPDAAESCGTWVLKEKHQGKLLSEVGSPEVLRYLQTQGLDLSDEIAKQITPQLVDRADRVIVMAEESTWPDYLRHSPKVTCWRVQNPDIVTMKVSIQIAQTLKAKCRALAHELR